MRFKYLQKKLKEDQKSILQDLDRLIEEELLVASPDVPREIQFEPLMPESERTRNLLGCVALDGILPSHLSLGLLSQLRDIREGATLSLEVTGTKPGLRDSWQRKIVITMVAEEEDGTKRNIKFQRKTEAGKVLLRFKASLGVNTVSVSLYGQHIQFSPFPLPIQTEAEKTMAMVGLSFPGQSQSGAILQVGADGDEKVEPGPARRREDIRAEVKEVPTESNSKSSISTKSSVSFSPATATSAEVQRSLDMGYKKGQVGVQADELEEEERTRDFSPEQVVLVTRKGVGRKAVFKEMKEPFGQFLVQFIEDGIFDLVSPTEVSHVAAAPPLPQQEAPRVETATADVGAEEPGPWRVAERCLARLGSERSFLMDPILSLSYATDC